MSLIAVNELERENECWTRDYWLRHCEGYGVESPEGHVGYVDEIVRADDSGAPVALRIRGRTGTGCQTVVVPIEQVREIRPLIERIFVDDPLEPVR